MREGRMGGRGKKGKDEERLDGRGRRGEGRRGSVYIFLISSEYFSISSTGYPKLTLCSIL